MRKSLPEIDFDNRVNPKSHFDIVRIESLFKKELDHDIFQNHLVKFFVIGFISAGSGSYSIDFVDYEITDSTVLVVRKDQVHKFHASQTIKGYLLVFTEDFIISHLNVMESLKTMQLFNDSLNYPIISLNNKFEYSDFTVLVKQIEKEYFTVDEFSSGITRSILHVLITKLFRIKAKSNDLVRNKQHMPQFLVFQKLVEDNCFKSRSVKYYSTKMAISTKTLNTITKNVVNSSAKVYIDERAIIRIKRLLISTELSIKEIAYTSGFNDPTNFFRYFKKFTKTSPENFRKSQVG